MYFMKITNGNKYCDSFVHTGIVTSLLLRAVDLPCNALFKPHNMIYYYSYFTDSKLDLGKTQQFV